MKKFWLLIEALQEGKQLANPAAWKKRDVILKIFTSFVILIPAFTDIPLSDHQIYEISAGLTTLTTALSSYWTVATTDKIGV